MKKKILLAICIIGAASVSFAGFSNLWTCPMHPQIKQFGPGKCPICNMNLIQVSDSTNEPATSRNKPVRTRTSTLEKRHTAISQPSIKSL